MRVKEFVVFRTNIGVVRYAPVSHNYHKSHCRVLAYFETESEALNYATDVKQKTDVLPQVGEVDNVRPIRPPMNNFSIF